jgi:hypothetical protein
MIYVTVPTFLARYSNREKLVSNRCTNRGQKFGVGLDLISLIRVEYFLVVTAIATRIFPIDICRSSVRCC